MIASACLKTDAGRDEDTQVLYCTKISIKSSQHGQVNRKATVITPFFSSAELVLNKVNSPSCTVYDMNKSH